MFGRVRQMAAPEAKCAIHNCVVYFKKHYAMRLVKIGSEASDIGSS